MLGAGDVGRRVVVRRRATGRLVTDILGDLVEVRADALRVRTDAGADVVVPLAEVVAAKAVPPRPAKYSEIAALERELVAGLPPVETAWLGQWLLRAAGGWTNRANTALVLGDPGTDLDTAVARVVAWYRERGLLPRFALPLPLAGAVDRHLGALGWERYVETLVRTADLDPLIGADLPSALPPVLIDDPPPEGWWRLVAGRKGSLPEVARRIVTAPPVRGFATVAGADGAPIAIGRGVVHGGWLGLSLIEVVPAARRRGLARHVVATLAAWGREVGARRAYLQVEADNTAAVALYDRLGFRTHHRYVHRRPTDG